MKIFTCAVAGLQNNAALAYRVRKQASAGATDRPGVCRNSKGIVNMEKDWTQLRVAPRSSPGVAAVATWQASMPPVLLLLFPPTPHIQNLFSVQQPDCLFQKGHIKTSSGPPISISVTQKAQKELPPTTYLASRFFPALPL